jgi:Rod binding domain-containing protein
MSKVNPVAGPRETAGAHSTAQTKTPVDPKVRKAAQEFEAMFVRQILTAAKIGGHDKQNGYDGMAVDAIAGAVTKGGGLGLSRQIEDAISQASNGSVKNLSK